MIAVGVELERFEPPILLVYPIERLAKFPIRPTNHGDFSPALSRIMLTKADAVYSPFDDESAKVMAGLECIQQTTQRTVGDKGGDYIRE
jgi:hypothetical protein